MLEKGIFTISFDTELAWGTFDHAGHIKFKQAYEKCRPDIIRILNLFNKYNISATWALVGHLFLESCHRDGGVIHPEITRPKYSWFNKDWFEYDPATDLKRDSIWYGRDIVQMIKQASPAQEIASHSFCHMIFSDSGCSKQAAESDIAKCVSLAQEAGIKLESFLFPRNAVGHIDLLSKYGFRAFRNDSRTSILYNGKPSLLSKSLRLFNDLLPSAPLVAKPLYLKENNLVAIPSSMLFRYSRGFSRLILPRVRYLKAKKGIDRAVKTKKVFHLWLHPVNFVWERERLFSEFESILSYASRLRDEGELEIMPLREIARQCGNNKINLADRFNPRSIHLHEQRAGCFKEDYSFDLTDYRSSAFKFGRKKIWLDLESMLQDLKPGSRILDLGCGTGFFLNLLLGKGFKAYGIDLSRNMLTKLKEINKDACVQLADARQLPYADNNFDAIISIETIRYFDKRHSFLNEIYRVLKPGGLAFITAAPLFSSNLYGLFNTFCRIFKLRGIISCYQSFETTRSLGRLLTQAGFSQISIKGHFFGPYFILDKVYSGLSSRLIKRFERIDDKLSRAKILRDFANHLVAVARKPGGTKQ